jgi:hypothetical protein
MNGRNNPSLDVVMKILNKYSYINTDWLLFGIGNMARNNIAPAQSDLFSNIPLHTPVISPKATGMSENRRETKIEKPQNIIKQAVQEPAIIPKTETRNVSKITIFYSDSTYEVFIPEKTKKD